MKNKKGMSLIVLVITIIVMIILAGIIVVSMSKNNPIENAKIAVLKTNISNIYSEVEMYIMSNVNVDGKIKYPVRENVPPEELSNVIRDLIAIYQNKYFETGLPDIWNIDTSRVYFLDENLIPTAERYKGKIILIIADDGKYMLLHLTGIDYKDDEVYKLEAILRDLFNKPTFHATTYNTYKIYHNGTLKCVGQKNGVSGATKSELEEIKYRGKPFISPVANPVKVVSEYGTTCILDKDGVLWGYGNNEANKLGTGNDFVATLPIKLMTNVEDFSIQTSAIWISRKDGTCFVAGNLYAGSFAKNAGENSSEKFVETIVDFRNVEKIFSSATATFIEYKDHTILASGNNYYGQLGTGEYKNYTTPFNLCETLGITEYKIFAPTSGVIMFVKPDNTLWATGTLEATGETKRAATPDVPIYGTAGIGRYTRVLRKVPTSLVPGSGDIKEVMTTMWNSIYRDSLNNIYIANKNTYGYTQVFNVPSDFKRFTSAGAFITKDNNLYKLNSSKGMFEMEKEYKNKYKDVIGNTIYTTDGDIYIPGDIIANFRDKISQISLKKIFDGKAKYVNGASSVLYIIDRDYKFWTGATNADMKLKEVQKVYPSGFILKSNGDLHKYNINNNAVGELILKDVLNFYPGGNNVVYTKANKVYYWGDIHYWENVPFIPGRDKNQNISKPTLMNSTVYKNGTIKQMAVRERDTAIMLTNGKLFRASSYWNANGEFGEVPLPSKVVKIVATFRNSFAVLENGDVYAWGENYKTMFGNGTNQGEWYQPIRLNLPEKIIDVEAGDGYAIFLAESDKIYGVGQNIYGQLGTGDFISTQKFVRCAELEQ